MMCENQTSYYSTFDADHHLRIQGSAMILVRVLIFCALSCGITVSEKDIIRDAELHVEHIKSILSKICTDMSIKDQMLYLGVCSRTTDDFENIWRNASDICKFSENEKITYKQLCEDDTWYNLSGKKYLDGNCKRGRKKCGEVVHCKGHRPSQYIKSKEFCDNIYNCIDRSDESNCTQRSNIQSGFQKVRKTPKLTSSQLRLIRSGGLGPGGELPIEGCGPPVLYSSIPKFQDLCPKRGNAPNLLCNDTIEMIRIGDKCHPFLDLCFFPNWNVWEDDHITFCQNHTFWSSKSGRKNWRTGNKYPLCTGNFPGFPSKHKPACLHEVNNKTRCPDFSDTRLCPSSACEGNTEYFPCHDEKFCIESSLICDGYYQCDDGSDEKNCSSCPPVNGVGHPPRSEADRWANQFPCKHRYTNRSICAIKCDGRDDLCEGYADERDCEQLSWVVAVLSTIIVISVIITLYWCLDVHFPSWFKLHRPVVHPAKQDSSLQLEVLANPACVADVRQKQFRAPILHNTIFRSRFLEPADMQQVCLCFFEHELKCHSHPLIGEVDVLHRRALDDTNEYFFSELGTTDVAQILYDSIDNALILRFKVYLARESPQIWTSVKLVQENLHTPLLIAFIFGHYVDTFKDVFLAYDFSRFLRGQGIVEPFSLSLFLVMVFSIVSGLLANLVVVATFERWSWKQKLLGCLFIILAPAAVQYRKFRLESQLAQMAKTCTDEREIAEARTDLSAMVDLKARFRANENILEHFLQLTVLLILSLIKDSRTTTAPPHLAKYVVEKSGFFLFASSAWSFLSVVRGQFHLTSSRKNGFVPFMGKIVLAIYFTIGTGARVWSLLLYFTPSLGLFNSLHHPTFATKGAKDEELAVFNVSADGTPTWFHELWNEHYRGGPDDFYYIPSNVLIYALLLLIVFHLAVSWAIQSKVYRGAKSGVAKGFFDALYTMICPPVYLDWEGIYRQSGGTLPKSECWNRSAKTMLAFQCLLLLEHLAMLVPLATLRVTIQMRTDFLGSVFPPVPEERHSTAVVNWLLFSGLAGFIIQSVLSLILPHLYIKRGHAWSRILTMDQTWSPIILRRSKISRSGSIL